MKWIRLINEERSWSFGPEGRDTSNWMGGSQNGNSEIATAKMNIQKLTSGGKLLLHSIPFTGTGHFYNRNSRNGSIRNDGGGFGNEILAVFFVDRHHSNGAELHWITDNGFIIITNAKRANGLDVCTDFLGRPGQIRRYQEHWEGCKQIYPQKKWSTPDSLLEVAQHHQDLGLNYKESKNWISL